MKTEEDEAFDDLARRQGAWGGGYQAKRQAAMDKVNSHFDAAYKKMHEDRAMYGTSWSQDGERIDPTSVYLAEPASDYERGFIDGMQKQAQSSVDKAVNQMAQPAQEPMATVTATVTSETGNPDVTMSWWHEPALPVGTKLYTAPPQRPWVGLTEDETQAYWDWEDWQTGAGRSTIFEMVRDIEAKLKEKNG